MWPSGCTWANFEWNLDYVEDMSEDEAAELKRTLADHAYYDENTW